MILDSKGRPLRRRLGFVTGYEPEIDPPSKPPRAPVADAIGAEAPKEDEEEEK